MSHSWLPISVGDQIPEDAVPLSDNATVFVGRAAASFDGWDYQITEISIEPETKTVRQICTAQATQFPDVGQVLVSQIVEWRPAKRGDEVPEQAIQFMNNGSDGPCVVARCIGEGILRACKLNKEGDTAWNFRYIKGSSTTPVQEGDILVESRPTVVIMCEHIDCDDGLGSIRCMKLSGDAIGTFPVPEGKDPYGPWLPEQVAAVQEGHLRLIKLNGDMV